MAVWTNIPGGGFGSFGSQWRQRASRFPKWGTPVLFLAALPGLLIALLSIALLAASLLALLLLTVPAFKLIVWLSSLGGGGVQREEQPEAQVEFEARLPSPGSKPVEVRVVDS